MNEFITCGTGKNNLPPASTNQQCNSTTHHHDLRHTNPSHAMGYRALHDSHITTHHTTMKYKIKFWGRDLESKSRAGNITVKVNVNHPNPRQINQLYYGDHDTIQFMNTCWSMRAVEAITDIATPTGTRKYEVNVLLDSEPITN